MHLAIKMSVVAVVKFQRCSGVLAIWWWVRKGDTGIAELDYEGKERIQDKGRICL